MLVWIGTAAGGKLHVGDDAKVSVADHGLLLGDSLFETVLTKGRRAQLLSRHLDRLERSSLAIGLSAPERAVISSGVAEILDSTTAERGRLRITLTSGDGPAGLMRGSEPRIIVTWNELGPVSTDLRLSTTSIQRTSQPTLLGLKTGSWIENVVAMAQAREKSSDDALMLNARGEVAETATSNIFLVKNSTVVTPPLSSGCLAGIARAFLIEHIPTDVRFAEMSFGLDEVLAADEVFVTSALRQVCPVSVVDQRTFSQERPLTTMLQSVFERAVEESDV